MLAKKLHRKLCTLKNKKSKNEKQFFLHSKDIKEPAKKYAISAKLMFSENAHIVQTAKVYAMKTKSKKHKNMSGAHTSVY